MYMCRCTGSTGSSAAIDQATASRTSSSQILMARYKKTHEPDEVIAR